MLSAKYCDGVRAASVTRQILFRFYIRYFRIDKMTFRRVTVVPWLFKKIDIQFRAITLASTPTRLFSISPYMASAVSVAADNEDCHRSHRILHNFRLPLDNRNGVN